jgi:hypothetical protein
MLFKKFPGKSGAVAHTYNSSYLVLQFDARPGKKFKTPHLNRQSKDVIPSMQEALRPAPSQNKTKPKTTTTKMPDPI